MGPERMEEAKEGRAGLPGEVPAGRAIESLFLCRPGARAAGQTKQQLPSEIRGASKGTAARVASPCSH